MFKNISMVAVILSISYACLYAGTGAVTPTNEELMQKAHRMQMPFIANEGQTDEQVAYYAKTFGGTVCVTKEGGIVYLLPKYEADAKGRHTNSNRAEGQDHVPSYSTGVMTSLLSQPQWTSQLHDKWWQKIAQGGPDNIFGVQPDNHKQELSGVTLKEEFVGGKTFDIRGEKRSETKVSYFRGNDPSKWKTNIATYEYATLGEVYKGIEIRLKAYGNNVEKLFCVKPGANPEQINIRLSGAETSLEKEVAGLSVNEQGELVTETALGPVKFTKPVAYQEINGKRVEVDVGYRLKGSAPTKPEIGEQGLEYGFTVASYDRTKDLIIDPLLASTFLGGSDLDWGSSIALDSNGNVFVTGYTNSTDFPTTAGADDGTFNPGYPNHQAFDSFISKFNNTLTSLLASTYFGGSDADEAYRIILDKNDNIFITGRTESTDLPTTPGAYIESWKGKYYSGFLSKFSNDLKNLLASTYLLGSGMADLSSNGIVLDSSSNVLVTGYFSAGGLPLNPSTNKYTDAFIRKFNNTLTDLLASTHMGGNGDNYGYGIALDSSDNVFITGYTRSTDLFTTSGAYDETFNGGETDAFVAKFNNTLTSLLASTYLGGSDYEKGFGIALDSNDNVFITGRTESTDLPTTEGAYDETYNGDWDVFVSKFNNNLTKLSASTFLGGSNEDRGFGIAIDTSDNIFIIGGTGSLDLPTTAGVYNGGGTDAFVSKFNNSLTSLLASTFLGGNDDEDGNGIALDSNNNVFVVGLSGSSDFPITTGVYQETLNGSHDAFVVKFDDFTEIPPTPTPSTTPVPTATTADTPIPTPTSVSTVTPILSTPTPMPTATATTADTPTPTPSLCKAKKLDVKPKSLKLLIGASAQKTVTLTCKGATPTVGQPVKAKIMSGKKLVNVSPAEAYTDGNGQATFTITAVNKTGNAIVRFKHKNLTGDVTVKVRKP